jgi:hypothetical protein
MIFLAIPYQETGSPPRMFRTRPEAEKWMRGQTAYGGSIYEFEQIDFDRGFRPILRHSNDPDQFGEDHIR